MGGKPDKAIFIIGVEHRSGTNFLSDLLALHDDCCRPLSIGEDYLLHHAGHLKTYATRLHDSWNPEWRESATQADIGAALGRSLLTLLTDQASHRGRRLVTKTPRADRLALFPWLFPEHPLLIIVRDGRAVAESAVRSFGWSYKHAIRRWNNGARRILEFDRDQRTGTCRYLIVRYEDLVTDLVPHLRRILSFLRLDASRYDFDAAINMPVRGSSTLKSQGQKLHWTPVAKSSDFRPLERARNWTPRQHRLFLARAGLSQHLLGYSVEGSHEPSLLDRLYLRWLRSRWQARLAESGLQPIAFHSAATPCSDDDGAEVPSIPLRRAA
jgi:protein-tyrosine sulfotransferase